MEDQLPQRLSADEVRMARSDLARIRASVERFQAMVRDGKEVDAPSAKALVLQQAQNMFARFATDPRRASDPQFDTLLDEINLVTCDVAVLPWPTARRGDGLPSGSSQFKVVLTPFNGKPDELTSWKATLMERFRTAGIVNESQMLSIVADAALLPDELRDAVTATSWQGFWDHLDRDIPGRVVRSEVWEHVAGLRPVTDASDQAAIAAVHAGVRTFNLRCRERGWVSEPHSIGNVETIISKLGPLRLGFFAWEHLKSFDSGKTDTDKLEEYLRDQAAGLKADLIVDARDRRAAEAGRSQPRAEAGGANSRKGGKSGWGGQGGGQGSGQGGGAQQAANQGPKQIQSAKGQPSAAFNQTTASAEPEVNADAPVYAGFKRAAADAAGADALRYLPATYVTVRVDRKRAKWVRLRCLVDEGSNLSYLSADAAKKLGFSPNPKGAFPLRLTAFGGHQTSVQAVPRVVLIRGLRPQEQFQVVLCELDQLGERLDGLSVEATRAYPHLQEARGGIPTEPGEVEMVLGYDAKALLLQERVVAGAPNEPIAIATKVAWMVLPPCPARAPAPGVPEGSRALEDAYRRRLQMRKTLQARRCDAQLDDADRRVVASVRLWCDGGPGVRPRDYAAWVAPAEEECRAGIRLCDATADADGSLTDLFRQWCQGDALGVAPTSRCVCTPAQIEEADFIAHVRGTMRLSAGRVEVPLPWKPGFPATLRNNRDHVAAQQGALVVQGRFVGTGRGVPGGNDAGPE